MQPDSSWRTEALAAGDSHPTRPCAQLRQSCIATSTRGPACELTRSDRAHAAWLWSGGKATLVGHSAAALLGTQVDSCRRSRPNSRTRAGQPPTESSCAASAFAMTKSACVDEHRLHDRRRERRMTSAGDCPRDMRSSASTRCSTRRGCTVARGRVDRRRDTRARAASDGCAPHSDLADGGRRIAAGDAAATAARRDRACHDPVTQIPVGQSVGPSRASHRHGVARLDGRRRIRRRATLRRTRRLRRRHRALEFLANRAGRSCGSAPTTALRPTAIVRGGSATPLR